MKGSTALTEPAEQAQGRSTDPLLTLTCSLQGLTASQAASVAEAERESLRRVTFAAQEHVSGTNPLARGSKAAPQHHRAATTEFTAPDRGQGAGWLKPATSSTAGCPGTELCCCRLLRLCQGARLQAQPLGHWAVRTEPSQFRQSCGPDTQLTLSRTGGGTTTPPDPACACCRHSGRSRVKLTGFRGTYLLYHFWKRGAAGLFPAWSHAWAAS